MVRASVTASPDSVAALSDSISRALLQHIWLRGEPPTPSLDAALKTRSAPALRAFLEGERALVENRWEDAAAEYASAISAELDLLVAVLALCVQPRVLGGSGHRQYDREDLRDSPIRPASGRPPVHRKLHGAPRQPLGRSRKGQEVTERFPDYWFGWLQYGDYLVHWAPILGRRIAEAGPVLERALQLNPRLTPAWEHLHWVYCKSRNSTGAARTIEAALARLGAGSSLEQGEGFDELLQFRLLARMAETGGKADPALMDSVVRANAQGGGAGVGLAGWCGFLPAQTEISRRILRLKTSSEVAARHRRFLAFTWVGRGAWDSVAAMLDESAKEVPNEWRSWWTALDRYALAVAGVWLGGLNTSEAAKRRDAAAKMVAAAPMDEGQPEFKAELVWLDGMLAWARGDLASLESARRELERVDRIYTSWKNAPWERSLAAFQLGLSGATRKAGFTLAALEWQRAERLSDGAFAQYLTALDRLAASRWLVQAGDTAQAARLLTWNEAWGGVSGSRGGRRVRQPRVPRTRPNRGRARERSLGSGVLPRVPPAIRHAYRKTPAFGG